MIHTKLEYKFHDSVILSCRSPKSGRIELVVKVYELFYPSADELTLTFSGIFNFETAIERILELNESATDQNWLGRRIDSLEFNDNKTSKDLDLHFVLEVDGYDPLPIHCKKLRITKSDPS